ncbi:MAG: VanZ family protein [Propionibacteriaceae bacterium]|jgi:hypothetical protein|nr:VanZ family protein [Propionibacteriaceae bacterium]
MGNYLSVFANPRMIAILGVIVLLAAGGAILLRNRLGGKMRQLLFFLFAVSGGGVLLATLFRENARGWFWYTFFTWNFDNIVNGRMGGDSILNIFLFVPLCLTATLLWRHPFRIAGLAVVLSAAIECVQGVTGIGHNDPTDILMNSLGAFIGSWIGWVAALIGERVSGGRWDMRALARAAVSGLAAAAVCLGGSWVGVVARQSALSSALEARFANTALRDYQSWEAAGTLDSKWQAVGPWPADAFSDDQEALVKYPARFFFVSGCVIAKWDANGFSTSATSATSDCG